MYDNVYVCVLGLVLLYAGDEVPRCLGNVVGAVHDESFVVGEVRLRGVALLVELVRGLL